MLINEEESNHFIPEPENCELNTDPITAAPSRLTPSVPDNLWKNRTFICEIQINIQGTVYIEIIL